MFKIVLNQRQYNDAIKVLQDLEIKIRKLVDTDLGKCAAEGAQMARSNAHVITGNMRNSTNYKKVNEMHYKVYSEAEYSGYENARGGDHAFMDKAADALGAKYQDILVSDIKKMDV